MNKTEKLLNEIVALSNNNPKVMNEAKELLDYLKNPKIKNAILVNDLPTDIKEYKNWYFNSHEAKDILTFADIQYQYECSKDIGENADNNFCEDDVATEIALLYSYMKKHKIDIVINK